MIKMKIRSLTSLTVAALALAAPLRAQPPGSDYATDLQNAGTAIQSRSAAMGVAMDQLMHLVAIQQAILPMGKKGSAALSDCSTPTSPCLGRLADAAAESDAALTVIGYWIQTAQDSLASKPITPGIAYELRDEVAAAAGAWMGVRYACETGSGADCGAPLGFPVANTPPTPRQTYMGRLMALAGDAGELRGLAVFSANYCAAPGISCSPAQLDSLASASVGAKNALQVVNLWLDTMEGNLASRPIAAQDIADSAEYITAAQEALNNVIYEDARGDTYPGQTTFTPAGRAPSRAAN